MQLTDNVAQSTAGAVQRFEDSCRTAILQSNNRSVEAASHLEDGHVFALSQENDANVMDEIKCPNCSSKRGQEAGDACCDNGVCRNGVCECETGELSDCRACYPLTFEIPLRSLELL